MATRMHPAGIATPHWTAEELAVVADAPHWHAATRHLPRRSRQAVYAKWRDLHPEADLRRGPRPQPKPIAWTRGARPPETPGEVKVAQILSAVYRVAQREGVAVDVYGLLDALGDGRYRTLGTLEWAPGVIIGRDIG